MCVSYRDQDGLRVKVEATAAVNGAAVWVVLPDGVVLDGLDWWLRSFRCETPPGELTVLETEALTSLAEVARMIDAAVAGHAEQGINGFGGIDRLHTRN